MIVDVSEIFSNENKEISKEVELELTSYNAGMGEFSILEKAPFTLSVANVGNKQLNINGKTEVIVAIPCDRCLEDVPVNFDIEISKEIEIKKFLARDIDGMEDAHYMIGTDLDVDKLIFGEILVSWPMKVLCREDCEGICKRCGTNLNLATCQCQKTEPDPRMAAIQDIFNQFKEV
jgi:uncharacterized protein